LTFGQNKQAALHGRRHSIRSVTAITAIVDGFAWPRTGSSLPAAPVGGILAWHAAAGIAAPAAFPAKGWAESA